MKLNIFVNCCYVRIYKSNQSTLIKDYKIEYL